uniref:Uncharacterized protein n=1 Tax=Anguilla anguilla TaxID=7936 RepID=A0A0E9Q3V4_ANGAN
MIAYESQWSTVIWRHKRHHTILKWKST